ALPREILLDILSRLPTTSLYNVKLVCQSWRKLAQDPSLVDMHFTRMPTPCLILHSDLPARNQIYAMSSLHLYNPINRDFYVLPKSTHDSETKHIGYEFCFNPLTKEYKVVQILHPRRPVRMCGLPERSQVRILTLGSSTWRSASNYFYHLYGSPLPTQTLVNGRLHWVSWSLRPQQYPGNVLVSLDLSDERLREVPVPDSERYRFRVRNLLVLENCLSASVYCDGGGFEIWSMKDYGVRESWIKEFRIGNYVPRGLEEEVSCCSLEGSKYHWKRSLVRVLCRLKNGEVLLEYRCRALVLYDPNSETFRDVVVPDMPNWFEAVAYIDTNNPRLPREVALDILSRLPITSLVKVKFVCRSWRYLAQDPLLTAMRLSSTTNYTDPCLILHSNNPVPNRLYVVDFSGNSSNIQRVKRIRVPMLPEFHVAGSCNGLLCLSDSLHSSNKNRIFIYNPFTLDCLELPSSSLQYPNQQVVTGFGFCSITNEFKVIKVAEYSYSGMIIRPLGSTLPRRELQIFNLGSNLAWRNLGEVPYKLLSRPSQPMVNGRLHWVATWPLQSSGCSCSLLVSFDLEEEQFREVPKPACGGLDKYSSYNLMVLGGCLAASVFPRQGQLEIWVMKEYGLVESWIRPYNIESVNVSPFLSRLILNRSNVQPLCLLKNGHILLEYKGKALYALDPKCEKLKQLVCEGLPEWFGTLVHLSRMENLPHEVMLDILSRLPTASLQIVKLVCKSWHNMAQDPSFVEMHFTRMAEPDPCLILHSDYPVLNQLYALYFYGYNDNRGFVRKFSVPPVMPEFDVVGSCNGWLCLCDSQYKNTFYVYNPFTSECTELAVSTQESGQWPVFGFGFDSTTKEYKVVKITHVRRNPRNWGLHRHVYVAPRAEVRILTVGSTDWRSLGVTSYYPTDSHSQVMVNGRLHWVNWPLRYRPGRMLISFDLTDEQFREIPKPDAPGLERTHYQLLVLGGCLSAAYYDNGGYALWVMKEYGVGDSWVKEFNVVSYVSRGLREVEDSGLAASKFYKERSFRRFLCGLKNGEILLEVGCRALVSYHPETGTFSDVGIPGIPNWFQSAVHVGCVS
ncbi:hypothetical protein Tsubulata_024095, partial [Turnera subulata]